MIVSISGKLQLRESTRVVVETAGLGYELLIPLSTYYRLPAAGSPVLLAVRQVIREDAWQLYGFASEGEKRAFDLLMQVQHVGPKLALAILSALSPEELVDAIGREDVPKLDGVPGVGQKVAERIVRELRDKVQHLAPVAESASGGGAQGAPVDDALSALINLGYRPGEAKSALDSIMDSSPEAAHELEGLIRRALAVLASER